MSHHPVGLSKIGQVSMRAKDLPRAVAFYQQTLGMTHLFTVGNMAFFDCDGVRLMLSVPEREEFDHAGSVIYYQVPSVRAMAETLADRGVTFESEPHLVARMAHHDLWMAFFRDSEDNLVALMSEETRTGEVAPPLV